MEMTQRLTDIWADINSITNWDDPFFDWKKAYVAAVFAKIAYLHIPQFELKNVNRANLIPCSEYREFMKASRPGGVEDILRDSDFGDFFIVVRPYAIAVVVKVRNVVFVSMRGTQQLYDWFVNFNATKSHPYTNVDIYFHKGFHRATLSCMKDIHLEILKRFGRNNIIYVTGHSLGGALAAILHALSSRGHMHFPHIGYIPWDENLATHSCYTFGMPRYGNFHAVAHFASPYHIYNHKDIVPTVPPRFLGFDDSLSEYCLTSDGRVDTTSIKNSSFLQFIFRLATLKGIRSHDMELYISRTKGVRDVS
jgi:hypothetical protein